MKIFISCFILCCLYSCKVNKEIDTVNDFSYQERETQEILKVNLVSEIKSIFNNRVLSKSSSYDISGTDKATMAQGSLDLIISYGLSYNEIDDDLSGITEDKLIEAALAIINIEQKASDRIELFDPQTGESYLTGNQHQEHVTTLNTRSQVFDCAMQAIGIKAVAELLDSGIDNLSKGATRKLLRKIASRYLGWVGVGIAVYEFGDCMEWW